MANNFKIKKALRLMEEFAAQEPVVKTNINSIDTEHATTNKSGEQVRAEIVQDVNTILTNLETLSKQIQEGFEEIKQDILNGNQETLEMFSSLKESVLVTEATATLGELMAYDADEDGYEYLKAKAKELGVKVSVSTGDNSMYSDMGYDTLSFSGEKAAVLKLASISGHDQDICKEPGCGGYELQEESVEILEADDTLSKKVMDFIYYRGKANSAMDKVNKVKQNAVAIDMAAKELDGSDKQEKAKKDKLLVKAKSAKEKADELEKAVRDKFSDRSELVQKAIQTKDIEGRLAAIKQESGMSDDPKKSKELKDKMKELQIQLKKEDDAIKQIEKDAEPEVKDASAEYKEEVKKLKAAGWKQGALPDGKEGEEKTLMSPEEGKVIFSKTKDAKGSFDEEKAKEKIDAAKAAKEAYTSVDGNNNPIEIAKLELVVLAAELEMAKGKGEDTKEIEDKIKAAKATMARKPQTIQNTENFDEEAAQQEIDAAQEAWDAVKDKQDQKPQDQAAIELELVKAKIKMAKGKGEDDKVAELEDKFMELEAIKNIVPQKQSGEDNNSVKINLKPSTALVEASVGGLQSITDDDYKYLKSKAKELGVKVSVDVDPWGDGTDELTFSGDKGAIMQLAGISGHASDISAGVYQLEESKELPKKVKLYEGMSIADKFKALM